MYIPQFSFIILQSSYIMICEIPQIAKIKNTTCNFHRVLLFSLPKSTQINFIIALHDNWQSCIVLLGIPSKYYSIYKRLLKLTSDSE